MATIRAYTTIEQSRKLAETLPLESADQSYIRVSIAGDNFNIPEEMQYKHNGDTPFIFCNGVGIPCWSLAALLKIIPKKIKNVNILRIDIDEKDFSIWYDEVGYGVNTELPDITMEYPVDACVAMIEKLYKLKML